MKTLARWATIAALGFCIGWTIGCTPAATNPTTSAQLAPGYKNGPDQEMGEILSGAHSFYQSIQQQSAAGTLVLSPDTKTKFNDFGIALNSAQIVYLGYHNGANTQAQAQAAVDLVKSKQNALPLPGAK